MHRIRIIFSKTEWITFLNHMDLPTLFSRAARRAGLSQEFTQGFSPRPRVSLGPPLAIGVEGLEEVAELWFLDWNESSLNKWNEQMPKGIRILKCAEVEGPVLSKYTTAAIYEIEGLGVQLTERALEVLKKRVAEIGVLYQSSLESGLITLTVGNLERCTAGNLVKALKENEVCEGWTDLRLVRRIVGTWDFETNSVLSLI